MQRWSTATGLMVDASQVLQETVGVLSNPGRGAAIVASGHVSRRVALWRTRAASLKSEFVRVLCRFLSAISDATMSGGQGCHHMRLVPNLDGFSHTPPCSDARGVTEYQVGRFSTDNIH